MNNGEDDDDNDGNDEEEEEEDEEEEEEVGLGCCIVQFPSTISYIRHLCGKCLTYPLGSQQLLLEASATTRQCVST